MQSIGQGKVQFTSTSTSYPAVCLTMTLQSRTHNILNSAFLFLE
jgi:hypothetical protein